MSRRGPRPTPRNLFSFSRLRTFHQCPARYRYRYLKGLREAFRSVESHLGSTLHDVLEWLYAQRETGADPEPAGREMLAAFIAGVFRRDRSTTIALERRYSVRLDGDLHFTGFADRVGRTENGRLFVVDYKTSRSLGNPSEFSEGMQTQLYAACALRTQDEPEAIAGYHYLRYERTRWHTVRRVQAERLLERFGTLAERARAATEFPPRPGPLCAWCGFNHLCPAAEVPEHLAGGRRVAEQAGGILEP